MLVALALGLSACRAVRAQAPTPARQLEDAIQLMETRGDLRGAIVILEPLSRSPDRAVAARALLYLGSAYEKLGRAEARRAYEQIVREFTDQPLVVAAARERLAAFDRTASPRRLSLTIRRSSEWDRETVGAIGPPTPDGRLAPGFDWETGNLVIATLATGKLRVVRAADALDEEGGAYAGNAVISPDGTRIAYTWYVPAGGGLEYGELWVSGLSGGGRKRLRRSLEEALMLGGWTPDGAHVLVSLSAGDRTSTIALADTREGLLRPLTSFPKYQAQVALSPDGRFVAYDVPQSDAGFERDLHILEVATQRETALVGGAGDERSPVWLADSKRLLFTSNRTGSTGLWVTTLEGGQTSGEPALLKGDLGRASLLGVTNAGAVYYDLQTGLADVFTSTRDPATGKWSSPRILPASIEGSNQFPAFSPDGRSIAYVARRGDAGSFNDPRTQALVVHDLRTGQERSFLPDASFPIHPRWSPDGRSLLFVGNIQSGVYRLDVASGEFTTIVHRERGQLLGGAEWARDGGSIYYGVGGEIRRRDLASGTDSREYGAPNLEWIRFVLPSHDGRYLAFTHRSGSNTGVYVTTTTFDRPKALVTVPKGFGVRVIAWTPDDREVVFQKWEGTATEGISELWRVPVAGGEPVSLGLAVRGMWNPVLSPDGRTAAFSIGLFGWETWVMEHAIDPQGKPAGVAAARGRAK